jgi:hypothetical protein
MKTCYSRYSRLKVMVLVFVLLLSLLSGIKIVLSMNQASLQEGVDSPWRIKKGRLKRLGGKADKPNINSDLSERVIEDLIPPHLPIRVEQLTSVRLTLEPHCRRGFRLASGRYRSRFCNDVLVLEIEPQPIRHIASSLILRAAIHCFSSSSSRIVSSKRLVLLRA